MKLRFARPMRTTLGEFRERDVVLLELRDGDGVCGWGEAAPWPGFGAETPADCATVLREFAQKLPGHEADYDDLCGNLESRWSDRPNARAAVEGALLDLSARRRGCPLRDELADRIGDLAAGAALSRVAVSALLVAESPDAVEAEAASAREAGFRCAKIKLGAAPLALDLARLRAAREGLGRDVSLRGDANGAWSADEAIAALEACAGFGLDYIEQPVAAGDLEGFAKLRGNTPVRIAADESVASEGVALQLIERALIDVVVLKPAVLGGPSRALGIAAQARHAGIDVVFTHTFESAVGARQALHYAAAWGDPTAVHGLVTERLFEQDFATPVIATRGWVEVDARPGLGILS